ncbi:MAG: aminotransferase class III-fold pyridoxal phosphate-dependent enzyme [Gammaproteobacteria bacterium]|nr:aminotransferase class III-fold pyridoxal phosphate-dependent enzyme [Gammaproteobacteria bacterium]
MRTVAIVQARMGSTRFPNKVMRPIGDTPMIGLLLQRLSRAKSIHEIIVATSEDSRNEVLTSYVQALGYQVHIGSETDVLHRYYEAAVKTSADVIVRITGDCPLVDAELVDTVVHKFMAGEVDYASNINPPSYPDGLDVEVFSFAALEQSQQQVTMEQQREHVTPYIRDSPEFLLTNHAHTEDHSMYRWTVDELDDFVVVEAIFNHFHPKRDFSWAEIIALQQKKPELFMKNQHLKRNEGTDLNTGQKLWKRAKQLIPGGNMLLSKRAEMFLPDLWPTYFSKAQGCHVWDLDGKQYIDMSIMGIGTNILGYGHPEIDDAVRSTIDVGNMCTLNCPEEVYLAERLVALHPWADMVRFARSGGEANAVAIRIARAACGKDKVAVCGYHGWHDWYLAANLSGDASLAGHLLPGLEPNGVPDNLQDTVYPFNYNRFDELEALIQKHDIGIIKMEVSRNQGPAPGFLEKVRQLANDKDIILIFDECTSGFRQTLGGLHKLYGVEPDMAMFGKAMGNGYAITAILGRRDIMEAAQTSFISSTFWTERIGPTAALKTLEVMEQLKSWDLITAIGNQIKQGWQNLAEKYQLKINLSGLPALSSFTFAGEYALEYKTLITQEMLAKGFLASNSVYACIAHTPDIIEQYFYALEPIFALIAECETGRTIGDLLKGPVCHAGFKRLN